MDKEMKALRRLIRETLLTEARFTAQTMIDRGYKIEVTKLQQDRYRISCVSQDPDGLAAGSIDVSTNPGGLRMGNCLGAWRVRNSETWEDGAGPLIYDIAIEMSGKNGLIPDRSQVSREARALWQFYHDRRSDIDHMQLDNLEDELTPGVEEDNCDQTVSDRGGVAWQDSALSKVYRSRGTPTIDELKRLGLIEFK